MNYKINKRKIKIPKHVAIIMDGNSRWARQRGKLPIFGYEAGVKSVKCAIKFAIKNQFKVLTLYAFSSENWKRPYKDVYLLMNLFQKTLRKEIKFLHKNKINLRIIGDISKFKIKLQRMINYSENLTSKNRKLILNIAMNYGGRWDITQSVKKIAIMVKNGIICPEDINENTLCKFINMNDLDPVDLVIRTGGEYRISNFLLWQIAYSELFFTDILWPDFNEDIFEIAINSFSKRERRFGKN